MAAGVEWVLGREGYLTCRDGERWWSDCSLPLRAAQYMMRTLEPGGSMAAMLWPAHAAQVRVALDRLARWQGVIVLLPQTRALRILLACDDFSNEIRLHRLWFAIGEEWEADLQHLLEENEGLPTPTQFVRPIAADNTHTDSLVAPAQAIFGATNARRATEISRIIGSSKPDHADSICLIAPSHFRLWDDAGETLAGIMQSSDPTIRYDADDPALAAPLALARLTAKSRAIVTAGIGRADLPDVAQRELPWVTWVTTPRIPASERRGPNDRLILADPSWQKTAIGIGWPAESVSIGGWPSIGPPEQNAAPVLAIIADLHPPEPPKEVRDYSSQAMLWENIAEELSANPLCLTQPDSYLDERLRQAQVSADGLDRTLFVERLIVPSYQRGLAYLLGRAGIAIRCHGRGWEKCAGLESIAGQAIESREELMEVIANSAALLHCWPLARCHPIDAIGRPVVKTLGLSREQLLCRAREAIAGKQSISQPKVAPISWELIRSRLDCTRMPKHLPH